MRAVLIILVLLSLNITVNADSTVTVGVPGVLTGDLAVMGDNIRKTIQVYQKYYLRHPIRFVFEDSKKSGTDGLTAYKKLIEIDQVDMLIGGTVSNGTMAGAPLINKTKTVMIIPLTGGSNIDNAGEYIFRIGNSDIKNAREQADLLLSAGLTDVALFTEQTEYTQDIAEHFRRYFTQQGGRLVFDENFLPDLSSFRSTIVRLKSRRPKAIFMSTQTGLAFGIFIKEYRLYNPESNVEIHTNFVAASNPDAMAVAGSTLNGVKYLAPSYNKANPRLIRFFDQFKAEHGDIPAIPMHTAGTVDTLELLQSFLDRGTGFDKQMFHDFLLNEVGEYEGLMGRYSFDQKGNADIGFVPYKLQIVNGEKSEIPLD